MGEAGTDVVGVVALIDRYRSLAVAPLDDITPDRAWETFRAKARTAFYAFAREHQSENASGVPTHM